MSFTNVRNKIIQAERVIDLTKQNTKLPNPVALKRITIARESVAKTIFETKEMINGSGKKPEEKMQAISELQKIMNEASEKGVYTVTALGGYC